MIEFVLLDLDDTVFDFAAAEHAAISATLREVGIEPSEEIISLYSRINHEHWKMLERGEMTRTQILTSRFDALFEKLSIVCDSRMTQSIYEQKLSIEHPLIDGAIPMLRTLFGRYRLFAVSNGTAHIQDRRIADSGIGKFFEDIFISQRVGADKPSCEFFDYCFNRIDGFCKERAIIIGDSPTSDIQGGKNAGIKTCLYDRFSNRGTAVTPDYRISSLSELPGLLERI